MVGLAGLLDKNPSPCGLLLTFAFEESVLLLKLGEGEGGTEASA